MKAATRSESRPRASDITYAAVRAAVEKTATWPSHHPQWLTPTTIIDILNGYDATAANPRASLQAAKAKLQRKDAWGQVARDPTAAQASAARRHLDKLTDEKLVEKQAGRGGGTRGFGYRWITAAVLDEHLAKADRQAAAAGLAARTRATFGIAADSSAVATGYTGNLELYVTVRLSAASMERLLGLCEKYNITGDRLRAPHFEIVDSFSQAVTGCTDNEREARDRTGPREAPLEFREVRREACRACGTVPPK